MLLCRLLPGTVIALVVHVNTIGDSLERCSLNIALQGAKKLIFAMKTASCVITAVFGLFQFAGIDNGKRDALFFSEGDSVAHLRARKAGRVGQDRQHCTS